MIVPRNRLLCWFAAVTLPLAVVGALIPEAVGISLVAAGGFVLVVAIDAVLGRHALDGIEVRLPAVARMSKGRDAKLEVLIRNERRTARRLRLALPLPRSIETDHEEMSVAVPQGTEWSRLDWPCRPLRRGNHRFDTVSVEGESPLGFWGVRARLPAPVELRIYPNLLPDRGKLAALFLNRGAFGLHAQQQVGKGREFEKLRDYLPGDSYEDIHWKATARRGHPVTKVFQIERTQEVYVVIDASRLSARPLVEATPDAGDPTRAAAYGQAGTTLERYVTVALVLGLAAEQQGDRFGLLTFTNRVHTFVRAGNGKAHYSACRDAIYTLESQAVNPDFDEVCGFVRLRMRRRALLIFLTALDDPVLAEGFVRNIELIARQHLVLVNMPQPPGAVPLFTDARVGTIDDLYEQLGGHIRWHALRELGRVLERRGVGFAMPVQDRMSAELVSQYLNVKKRQLL
jgi:uncharacterized protein (DUF58 family)